MWTQLCPIKKPPTMPRISMKKTPSSRKQRRRRRSRKDNKIKVLSLSESSFPSQSTEQKGAIGSSFSKSPLEGGKNKRTRPTRKRKSRPDIRKSTEGYYSYILIYV